MSIPRQTEIMENVFDSSANKLKIKDTDLNTKIDALNVKIDSIISGATPASMQLTGRNVKQISVTFNTTVGAGSNATEEIVVPSGKIWIVQDVSYNVIAPSGAISGTHFCAVYLGSIFLILGTAAFNKKLERGYSGWYNTSTNEQMQSFIPNDLKVQASIFKNLKISSGHTLFFRYFNSTDVLQEGVRTVRLSVVEEAL